jgi:hypothetical protein
MTLNTPTPTYGEPWKPLQPDLIYDSYSHWMADAFNPAIRDRILACINACAGIADPEKEIAAMREAIREACEAIKVSPYPDQQALAKLQPFTKP